MDILLDSKCLNSLVASSLEVYNRETNGFLTGKSLITQIEDKGRRVVSLENAYPLQTAQRKPSQVINGNDLAHKRTIASFLAMNCIPIGGYHSHTLYHPEYSAYPELSQGDIEHINEEVERIRKLHGFDMKKWLEVILTVKKKEYVKPHRTGIQTKAFPRKLGCTVIVEPHVGYELTISGFWLKPNGTPKLKPHTEAKVYLGQ